jgi:uncharacterized iron-regulated protein
MSSVLGSGQQGRWSLLRRAGTVSAPVLHSTGKPLLLIAIALSHLLTYAAPASARIIFRLRNMEQASIEELVADLKKVRVVIIGERHDSAEDHVAQRTVIQALHDAGVKVSVGLEMFRAEEQPALDQWVDRTMGTEEFQKVYDRNWTPAYWNLYNDVLIYARQEGLPLVGLNIRQEIPNQVAREGFASLGADQRRMLGIDSCEIPDRYEDLLRRVLGGKAGGSPRSFDNFCQAQLVWDYAMASAIAGSVAANPDRTLVVLCGTFHAWRHGIPQQLERISPGLSHRIILPSSDKTFLNYDIFLADADYVWWQQ